MVAGVRAGRARCCCADAGLRVADRGRGELAGLPEGEELFEAGEDAGEDASDQSVDQGFEAGRQADARLLPQGAWGGGDRGAEGWMRCHRLG